MIEAGLFTLLSNSSAIAALCGTRIYPVILPTGPTYPAMSYQLIGAKSSPTFETSGMQRFRVQFDCFGESYSDAIALRGAVGKFLNGYQGTLSDGTVLQNARFIQLVDYFGDDARIYRSMSEFYLYFDFQ